MAGLFAPDPEMAFWPTPSELADDVVYHVLEPWHHLGDGVRVLEPSAGDGNIVAAARERLPDAHITAVEPSRDRAAGLRARIGLANEVVESTLEQYLLHVSMLALAGSWEPFDLVLMNPPFALAGQPEAWAEHVLAIYNDPYLVKPGGVLSAVVPRIVLTGKSKLVRAVRELLGPCRGAAEACDKGAFAEVGAGVSVALLWAQKPFAVEVESAADEGVA